MDDNDDPIIWYASGGVLVCVLAALCWIVFGGHKPQQSAPPSVPVTVAAPGGPAQPGDPSKGALPPGQDAIGDFDERLAKWTPHPTFLTMKDFVDGKDIQVPSVEFHNLVCGTATDLMSPALGLDPKNPRRPVPSAQEWQMKLVTSPSSLATYMEIDFLNAKSGYAKHVDAMKDWNLAKLCPALAAVPQAQWTDDERNYVHYLTVRQMGFDNTEQGFRALWAGYASNYAVWHGDKRTVPGAAYYALAATHFEKSLAAGELPNPRVTAATWMICGEMHRLLDQWDDARRCFGEAQKLRDTLQPEEQAALDLYNQLVRQQDDHLERLPQAHEPTPPIGWYVELMFPAINGDLDVERAHWSSFKDSDTLNAQICQAIAAKAKEQKG